MYQRLTEDLTKKIGEGVSKQSVTTVKQVYKDVQHVGKTMERHYLRLKYLRFNLVGDEHEKIIQCIV